MSAFTLIILGMLVVISGIIVLAYFFLKPDNFAPKDKFQETGETAYQAKRTWTERFEEILYKSSLTAFNRGISLFITFGIAVVTVPVLMGLIAGIKNIPTEGINSLILIVYFPVVFILISPIAIPMFPGGLIAVITYKYDASPFDTITLVVGWAIYVAVILFGLMAKNRYVFMFIYLIFVMLLIMNISGCTITAPKLLNRIN